MNVSEWMTNLKPGDKIIKKLVLPEKRDASWKNLSFEKDLKELTRRCSKPHGSITTSYTYHYCQLFSKPWRTPFLQNVQMSSGLFFKLQFFQQFKQGFLPDALKNMWILNPLVPGDFFSRISLPNLVERCIAWID